MPEIPILLVDDRPENLVALGAILTDPRYHLVTATSGEEALREALREEFTLALIDVAMPGMDGLEVARHLKKLARSRDLPI
jgi:CheY-like chemotaxis protein